MKMYGIVILELGFMFLNCNFKMGWKNCGPAFLRAGLCTSGKLDLW